MPRLVILLMLSASLCSHAGLQDDTPQALEQKVAQGDPAAMCELGNRVLRGRNADTDVPRGKQLVSASAGLGHAECQFYLGAMYKDGRWFDGNAALAISWFSKAADQGLPIAQLELGLAYQNGLGELTKNEGKALDWFRRAALQRHTPAMYHYGRRLLDTHPAEGRAWLQLASEKGDFDAQSLLDRIGQAEVSERVVYEKALMRLRSSAPAAP